METAPIDIAAPSAMDRDIPCPLCGYNLRGLTVPRCPECGHVFQWNELFELGNRHPYFFEHNRRGLRAIVSTWAHSLFPRRFWRTARPTHEPHRRRLLVHWICVTTLALLLLTTPLLCSAGAMYVRIYRFRSAWLAMTIQGLTPQQLRLQIAQYGSMNNAAAQLFPYPDLSEVQRLIFPYGFGYEGTFASILAGATLIVLWPPLTLATLMLYRRVFRHAKIRIEHVMRMIVYGTDIFPLVGLGLGVEWWFKRPYDPFFWSVTGPLPGNVVCVLVLMIMLLLYRLLVANQLYLRLPLRRAIVLTQVLVVLFLLRLYQFVEMGW